MSCFRLVPKAWLLFRWVMMTGALLLTVMRDQLVDHGIRERANVSAVGGTVLRSRG